MRTLFSSLLLVSTAADGRPIHSTVGSHGGSMAYLNVSSFGAFPGTVAIAAACKTHSQNPGPVVVA